MNSSADAHSTESTCEFDQNLNTLRNISFFSELGPEPLKALTYLCKRMQYRQGDILFEQGELDDKAYCLISGSLQIFREEGGERHALRELEPGAFIGALSLVAQAKRLFSLQATSAAICMILPQKHFLPYISKSPEFAVSFFKALYRSMFRWEEELLSGPRWPELQKDGTYLGVTLI